MPTNMTTTVKCPICTDFTGGSGGGGSGTPGAEENTPKKRRITGTKRIEFEAAYAKVSQWLASVSISTSSSAASHNGTKLQKSNKN